MADVGNKSADPQFQTEKNDNIQVAPAPDYSAPKARTEQLEDARGWESENLIQDLSKQLEQANYKKGFFDLEFKNPKHFTWMLIVFASMGKASCPPLPHVTRCLSLPTVCPALRGFACTSSGISNKTPRGMTFETRGHAHPASCAIGGYLGRKLCWIAEPHVGR